MTLKQLLLFDRLPVPTWIRHVTPFLVDRNLLDHVRTSESKAGELRLRPDVGRMLAPQ
jgi:hypothetical protein